MMIELELSGIFWNFLEFSGIFWNFLEWSGTDIEFNITTAAA